jgi:amino acid adenylation domain
VIYLLPHSISNSANQFPNREAFRFGAKSLTFNEINVKMNQLANLLHQIGIKKGDRIGIYLNRSLETAIAMYGIMQAGAIYVPLDPKVPVERTQFLINDCGIKILITNNAQRRNIQNIVASKVTLEAIIGVKEAGEVPTFLWEKIAEQPTAFTPSFSVLEDDVAYIIYTSGSTGNPKGIMHTHASGLAYARLTADLYDFNEKDVFGNHAPIFFDISTLGYFTAPFVGGCTVIASDAHTIMPASLSQLIEKEKITVWYSVPLALIQMLQNGLLEEKNMNSLRWVLYAGEAFPPKYLRQLMELWDHATFSNIYGPTELNQCTYYNIPSPPIGEEGIPLGKVWSNTESIVLDENEEELTSGVGELCVRSTTMMKGYWQKPERTEASFYRRKNSTNTDDIFYRTGDLVRLDENNVLHFLGRKDYQVKIRGHRVELGSIESKLISHEAVEEAVVLAIRKKEENLELEAVIILEPDKEVSEKTLILYLKNKLPLYAIPEKITFVKTFPRTSSGKVKRSALKETLHS